MQEHAEIIKEKGTYYAHTKAYASLAYAPTPYALNPFLKKNKDSIFYIIANYGTGAAFNIKSTVTFLKIVNGIITVTGSDTTSSLNKTITIPVSKDIGGYAFFAIPNISIYRNIGDSIFACIKINYDDNTGIRKSLPKIFYVRDDFRFIEPSDMDFNEIEKFLISHKYWKKPFKQ